MTRRAKLKVSNPLVAMVTQLNRSIGLHFSEQKAENMAYHVNTTFSLDDDENGFETSRRYRNLEEDAVSTSVKSSIYQ